MQEEFKNFSLTKENCSSTAVKFMNGHYDLQAAVAFNFCIRSLTF